MDEETGTWENGRAMLEFLQTTGMAGLALQSVVWRSQRMTGSLGWLLAELGLKT